MSTFRRELPGNLLQLLSRQHGVVTVADFDREHAKRVSKSLEAMQGELTEAEYSRLSRRYDLGYGRWANRFALI